MKLTVEDLIAKSKESLKLWTKLHKKAQREGRSGDARMAADQMIWLNGYIQALKDSLTLKP